MIDELQYDVIYHEHTMYHSVLTLKKFLEKNEMKIFDVKHFSIRGGVIRIYATFKNSQLTVSENVQLIINSEIQKGYDKIEILSLAQGIISGVGNCLKTKKIILTCLPSLWYCQMSGYI